jgi:hypothetical protein
LVQALLNPHRLEQLIHTVAGSLVRYVTTTDATAGTIFPMSDVLDYGRRRSRRNWRVLAVAIVVAVAVFFSVRSWRAYQARLEDQRLQAQQRKYRQEFDREFTRQLQSASGPPPARASTRP